MTTKRTFEEVLAEIARTSTPTGEFVRRMTEAVTGLLDSVVDELVEYDLDNYELLKELIETKFYGLPVFRTQEIIFADKDDGNDRKSHIYNRNMGRKPNTFNVFVYATGSGLFVLLQSQSIGF